MDTKPTNPNIGDSSKLAFLEQSQDTVLSVPVNTATDQPVESLQKIAMEEQKAHMPEKRLRKELSITIEKQINDTKERKTHQSPQEEYDIPYPQEWEKSRQKFTKADSKNSNGAIKNSSFHSVIDKEEETTYELIIMRGMILASMVLVVSGFILYQLLVIFKDYLPTVIFSIFLAYSLTKFK